MMKYVIKISRVTENNWGDAWPQKWATHYFYLQHQMQTFRFPNVSLLLPRYIRFTSHVFSPWPTVYEYHFARPNSSWSAHLFSSSARPISPAPISYPKSWSGLGFDPMTPRFQATWWWPRTLWVGGVWPSSPGSTWSWPGTSTCSAAPGRPRNAWSATDSRCFTGTSSGCTWTRKNA